MSKQCFELRALPQLLTENDKTVPQTAGHFFSYCQKMPQQCLEMGPSSVTVRKCLNNASNWGLRQLLSENASTMPLTGAFFSYSQKMPKQCFELRALLQLLSENDKTIPQTAGHFFSYCHKTPQQCLELGPSSVIVRKCLNNASNWGLPQLLSENASTVPRTGAFLSYCQKMPKQFLELGTFSQLLSENDCTMLEKGHFLPLSV